MRIAPIFRRLARHCADYRRSVDQIFCEDDLSAPLRLQSIFRQIQIRTAQLQVDGHQLLESIPKMRMSSKAAPSVEARHDLHRERDLRTRLQQRLEQLQVWNQFDSENPLAALVGLHSTKDYIQSLELHPAGDLRGNPVFGGVFECLSEQRIREVAVVTIIGLQHMGRNHISFLQPALDWLVG